MALPSERKAIRLVAYKDGIVGNTVRQIFSVTGVVDDGGDIIHMGAFQKTLQENADRIKALWSHNYMEPPVGVVRNAKEVLASDLPPEIRAMAPDATGGLYAEVEYLDTSRGQEVLTGIKAGAITENSIGYDAIKWDYEDGEDGWPVRNLREVRLMDVSPVVWGMNPYTGNYKKAMPFKDTGKADMGMAWSKPGMGDFTDSMWADLSDTEKNRIAAHFAWEAGAPPETFGDLRLPHHQPSKDGVGPAVWRGVTAAMSRLMQQGTGIPDGERRAVYDHLAKHYAQFDQTPPDFKSIQLAAIVDEARLLVQTNGTDFLKAGRALSAANIERLKGALDILTSDLAAAEPPSEEPVDDSATAKALVVRVNARALTDELGKRLDMAERELRLHS